MPKTPTASFRRLRHPDRHRRPGAFPRTHGVYVLRSTHASNTSFASTRRQIRGRPHRSNTLVFCFPLDTLAWTQAIATLGAHLRVPCPAWAPPKPRSGPRGHHPLAAKSFATMSIAIHQTAPQPCSAGPPGKRKAGEWGGAPTPRQVLSTLHRVTRRRFRRFAPGNAAAKTLAQGLRVLPVDMIASVPAASRGFFRRIAPEKATESGGVRGE
jgi:hypothetical protein